MFTVGTNGSLSLATGSPVATGGEDPLDVAFSPFGLLAVSNFASNSVSVFSVGRDGKLSQIPNSPFALSAIPYKLAFSPSGLLAVTTYLSSTVSVFSVSGAGSLVQVPGSPLATGSEPGAVGFSPRGLLAVANLGSDSVSVFSVGAPSAVIHGPAAGGVYGVGQVVRTSFSCGDAAYAPGVVSCVDSRGGAAPGGVLDTSTVGAHSYSVTATSGDGQTATAVVGYTVAGPPAAVISVPALGAIYVQGRVVRTRFSCVDGVDGPGISSCVDSTKHVAPAGQLDTSTLGTHSYTVTAASVDGQVARTSITYVVVPGPPVASLGPIAISGPRATLTMKCAGDPGQRCSGAITVITRVRKQGGRIVGVAARKNIKRAKRHAVSMVVGRGTVGVAAGKQAKVVLNLTAAGKRLLTRFYRLPRECRRNRVSVAERTSHAYENSQQDRSRRCCQRGAKRPRIRRAERGVCWVAGRSRAR